MAGTVDQTSSRLPADASGETSSVPMRKPFGNAASPAPPPSRTAKPILIHVFQFFGHEPMRQHRNIETSSPQIRARTPPRDPVPTRSAINRISTGQTNHIQYLDHLSRIGRDKIRTTMNVATSLGLSPRTVNRVCSKAILPSLYPGSIRDGNNPT